MASQICSHCGYEGRGRHIGERKGGGVARVLGIVTLLPVYTLWRAMGNRAGKQCPHCGLPTMVKLNSNTGRLARHRLEVELGRVLPMADTKTEELVFGNERTAEKIVMKKPVNPEQW
ncbi:MAG: hypothetical protein SFW64_01415 [Alphaproteobacteria bacterium]|nr:hypothetical protein [Alphaproteobacteria bacterium]